MFKYAKVHINKCFLRICQYSTLSALFFPTFCLWIWMSNTIHNIHNLKSNFILICKAILSLLYSFAFWSCVFTCDSVLQVNLNSIEYVYIYFCFHPVMVFLSILNSAVKAEINFVLTPSNTDKIALNKKTFNLWEFGSKRK